MAIQQLTQPIINPIAAFDASRDNLITFVVIGGTQVIANRLVISDNETGTIIYNKTKSTMKLEHTIPADTLGNGGYYNAVVYTIDSAGNESDASTPVPFYCYSQPTLTISNIPTTETIGNGTYTFIGDYSQPEGEILNSYQFTLYDSNKDILSQTPLIYYITDSSLSYTFVGMSNDTAYYISISGETVNGTKITSGLVYFTVRYLQPASFAICDLVNDCENGYIQISSNIVAIDGKSNPEPPIYIDDKEVDLRDPDSWVEWDEGFNIKDDFTMRIWGRDFNPYENIITLINKENQNGSPNKIELKWMIGDILKVLPEHVSVKGENVNIKNSEADSIMNLDIGGNSSQKTAEPAIPSPSRQSKIYSVGERKNLIDVPDFNILLNDEYGTATKTDLVLKPNYTYTLSFDYDIHETSTDIYYSIGYGLNSYEQDIKANIVYQNITTGKNSATITVPNDIPTNNYLWIKFGHTTIIANADIDIKNVQFEIGKTATKYQSPNLYNIYPTVSGKNLYDYNNPLYVKQNNISYNLIGGGYNIKPTAVKQSASLILGIKNILNPGETYAISFENSGQLSGYNLYITDKESEESTAEIIINNGVFTAPEGLYDLQLSFSVDSSSLDNFLEIWNIQIEANDVISEYETYNSNNSQIVLSEPIRGLGERRDLICLDSPNIINPETQSATVEGSTVYYLNQKGSTEYYIWYYNEEGNLITFVDPEGQEASGAVGINGQFTTHKDCVKITITKSNNPKAGDVTSDELISNQVIISKGSSEIPYYPYITKPSVIRYIGKITLNGTENWVASSLNVPNYKSFYYNFNFGSKDIIRKCNYFSIGTIAEWEQLRQDNFIENDTGTLGIRISDSIVSDLNSFKLWLIEKYNNGSPVEVYYVLSEPVIEELSTDNISALQSLKTYLPISNVFTNNDILATSSFDYVDGYTEQQTENAYVLLKCWNSNTMPYVIHSNFIDIPKDINKVFIWMRRKNNIFDLKIEDLGDYGEDDEPTDVTKPVVSIEINPDNVTSTQIPVTATSVDETGLRTVRFSKNNGESWDEVVPVDGLSSINSYAFSNLNPNTVYPIRVEAIDLAGNIGGITQNVSTK